MKKLVLILVLFSGLTTKAQLGWEGYYSAKDFRERLQQAKTPADSIYAFGFLGKKGVSTDSIMREIYAIADKSNEKELSALALWWDGMLHEDDTTRMIKLFQFAKQNQLLSFQIAADLSLADYYIHQSRVRSLYYAQSADSLLEKWQGSKKEEDSLKIEVYRRIAHAYIHNEDAINKAKYLLALRNYAERGKDEHIKILAAGVIGDMYSESGHKINADKKRSLPWNIRLHEYFKKANELQKYFGQTYELGLIYSQLYINDSLPDYKANAISYFREMDKLIDSLNTYDGFLYWALRSKFDIGMLSGQEIIDLLDNNYNSHYRFSDAQIRELKVKIYSATNQFDSLKVYISKFPDPRRKDFLMKDYYLQKGEFDKAIPILKSLQKLTNARALHSIYNDFVKAYVGIKDYKLAYEYKLKALQMKDTLDKQEGKEEIASMEVQKQVELQQAAFDDEQAKAAYRNRIRVYGFIAGLAALLIVTLILLKNNRRKQRDKLKIEKAYSELKATQQQLIQSEKMASLGELTAGIAHEIQNPLNFVNNFSDVNKELLVEMKDEMDKGNIDDAKAIANDVIENEEKINHHGKRADAIVKNMLQHSRSTSGAKESTDINALADEYLRLSYHGLRAKDKSFNATMKTDFDGSLGKINIIPQDIGRVVLNLINNAFYAVDEKKKHTSTGSVQNGYEPTVSVSTKRNNEKVEISVKDNGNGIPQKVLDKIFQPFFTTKPTGQGTGLGLSLSYDIVKAHNGEIKVNTKESEGSEFVIMLPVK